MASSSRFIHSIVARSVKLLPEPASSARMSTAAEAISRKLCSVLQQQPNLQSINHRTAQQPLTERSKFILHCHFKSSKSNFIRHVSSHLPSFLQNSQLRSFDLKTLEDAKRKLPRALLLAFIVSSAISSSTSSFS